MLSIWICLLLASATGLWVTRAWWRQAAEIEHRAQLHGATAALVLVALFLCLDNRVPSHGLVLLAGFLSVATGMLMFLMRQRQQRFPRPLLALHIGLSLAAIALSGALLV